MKARITERIDAALDNLRPQWSEQRAHAVAQALTLRRQRRARRRAGAAAAVAVVIALGGAWLAVRPSPSSLQGDLVVRQAMTPTTTFLDGSYARGDERAPEVHVAFNERVREVRLLSKGRVHVVVAADVVRPFLFRVGGLLLKTMAATFVVNVTDAGDPEDADVVVQEGVVIAERAGRNTTLRGPEEAAAPEPRVAAVPPSVTADGGGRRPKPRAHRHWPRWRELAGRGRYDEAFEALPAPLLAALPDEPEVLLQAADVARLSHHPREAVAPLRRVVDQHAHDERAALAAFTLGLVYLQQLHEPARAAAAFAEARTLAPQGVLAEDALARQAESHHKAGAHAAASATAQTYLRLYPDGRRASAMRGYQAAAAP